MGIEAKQSAATPQALRASSTRRGMATHAQLKLRFAAHLAGEPKIAPCQLHPQTRKGMAAHTQLKLRFTAHLVGEALTCIAPKLLLWKFPQGSPARGAGAQRLRGCCDELSFDPLEKDQGSALSQNSNPSVTASPCHLHPQGDGDSHAAEAAVRCSPSRGGLGSRITSTHKGMATHLVEEAWGSVHG